MPSNTKEKLEDETGGIFTDLRLGLFMVNWQEAHVLSRANCVLMWNKNNVFCGKCGAPTKRNAAGEWLLCCMWDSNLTTTISLTLNQAIIIIIIEYSISKVHITE